MAKAATGLAVQYQLKEQSLCKKQRLTLLLQQLLHNLQQLNPCLILCFKDIIKMA